MKNIGKRIEERRQALGLSKTNIWKNVGVSSGAYTHWLNGGNVKSDVLLKLAKLLNVTPEWLSSGKGPDLSLNGINIDLKVKEGVINIPLLNSKASMGDGEEIEHETLLETIQLNLNAASKLLAPYSSYKNLAFITAYGDSMAPTFNDGDVLLIDTGDKNVTADKVYVLEAHNRLFIKRVRQRIDGKFEISSDNPLIKTVDVLNGDHEVLIKGRVIWVWNGKKL